MKFTRLVLATSLLAMFSAGFALADKHEGSEGKKKLEAERDTMDKITIGDGHPDPATRPSSETHMNLRTCRGNFTVDYIGDNPHIKRGDRFLVLGPIPWANILVVKPLNPGSGDVWEVKSYTATPTGTPSDYQLKPRVKPHQSKPDGLNHNFLLRVETWKNRCPEYVRLVHQNHEFELFAPLHPGHAGASRD